MNFIAVVSMLLAYKNRKKVNVPPIILKLEMHWLQIQN